MQSPVQQMPPPEAARILERALSKGGPPGDLTIADAATRSGLSLRDAERGLHSLVSTYRGHLRVTSEGELLFRFPNGFTKPWETRTRIAGALDAAWRGLVGVARFVVRAWITIVLVGYALIFVAILVAMAFAQSSGNNNSRRGGVPGLGLGSVLGRVVFDALFWTFHPFSPFAIGYGPSFRGYEGARTRRRAAAPSGDGVPFYEKVNRFFFGPQDPPADPLAMERRILAEIRAQKGRIGLADVMRVTGLPRSEADPLMARLMLDYDGSVEVGEQGGITYHFEGMRKTVGAPRAAPARPVWAEPKRQKALTGNDLGANLAIAGLNAFNALMGFYAVGAHLTVDKVTRLVSGARHLHETGMAMALAHETGTAVALGYVPLIFSLALFALPIGRALARPIQRRRIAKENGRLAVLREVIEAVPRGPVTEGALTKAWEKAAGSPPGGKELTREIVALGGDAEVQDDGRVLYRFPDLEAEGQALEAEREAAADEEARVGKVIFSSDA
jgi:hypothetical protein